MKRSYRLAVGNSALFKKKLFKGKKRNWGPFHKHIPRWHPFSQSHAYAAPLEHHSWSANYIAGFCFQALQDNGGLSGGGAVSHFEPQVALLCDTGVHGQEAYHPQYMTEQGRWQTDLTSKASCLKDKMDILDYCKKVSGFWIRWWSPTGHDILRAGVLVFKEAECWWKINP